MDIVFKVVDRAGNLIGFIQDPLLNLSLSPDDVIRASVSSKSQLLSCTKRYQNNLNNLLKLNTAASGPLLNISWKIYNKHFSKYKSGDLKVITSPTNQYL